MSKENLSERINPFRLAEAGASLHRSLFVKDMSRLSVGLADDSGQVEVDIQFGIDQQGTRFLRGHFETSLKVQCQRCMEPFAFEIIGDLLSGVIKTEAAAKALPSTYEPVLVDEEDMLSIQDMIEDELIVGMPIVPRHDSKNCKVDLSKIVLGSDSDEESKGDDNNPFKVIDILRAKNRNRE